MEDPLSLALTLRDPAKYTHLLNFFINNIQVQDRNIKFHFFEIPSLSLRSLFERIPDLSFLESDWKSLSILLHTLYKSPVPRPNTTIRQEIDAVVNERPGIYDACAAYDPENQATSALDRLVSFGDFSARAAKYVYLKQVNAEIVVQAYIACKDKFLCIEDNQNKLALGVITRSQARNFNKELNSLVDDLTEKFEVYQSISNNFSSQDINSIKLVLSPLDPTLQVLEYLKPSELLTKSRNDTLKKTIAISRTEAKQDEEILAFVSKLREAIRWQENHQQSASDTLQDSVLPYKVKELRSLADRIKNILTEDKSQDASDENWINLKLAKQDLSETTSDVTKIASQLGTEVSKDVFGYDLETLKKWRLELAVREELLSSNRKLEDKKREANVTAYSKVISPKKFDPINRTSFPKFLLDLRKTRAKWSEDILLDQIRLALSEDDRLFTENISSVEGMLNHLKKRYGDTRQAITMLMSQLSQGPRPTSIKDEQSKLNKLYSLLGSVEETEEINLFTSLKLNDLINSNASLDTSKVWFSLYQNHRKDLLKEELSKATKDRRFETELELDDFLEKHQRKEHIILLQQFIDERLEVLRQTFGTQQDDKQKKVKTIKEPNRNPRACSYGAESWRSVKYKE